MPLPASWRQPWPSPRWSTSPRARIPHSKAAPAVELGEPGAAPADNGRMKVTADVGGASFYEVTFEAKTAGGGWAPIGTDDTAPYQVFHDVAALAAGTAVEYRTQRSRRRMDNCWLR